MLLDDCLGDVADASVLTLERRRQVGQQATAERQTVLSRLQYQFPLVAAAAASFFCRIT